MITKVVTQNMKMFPKYLKNQRWKQLKLLNAKTKGFGSQIEQLHIIKSSNCLPL